MVRTVGVALALVLFGAVVVARTHAAAIKVIAPSSLVVVDGSDHGGSEIECLAISDGSLWCSLSKIGAATALPNTCGVRVGSDFAAIVCRSGSAAPKPAVQRQEPRINGSLWPRPRHRTLVNLLGPGEFVAIAGSHTVCFSPSSPRGSLLCLPEVGGKPVANTWGIEMTPTRVGLGRVLPSGVLSPIGLVRPVHL